MLVSLASPPHRVCLIYLSEGFARRFTISSKHLLQPLMAHNLKSLSLEGPTQW